MGRYKGRDTTKLSDKILPPQTSRFEFEDTKTGRIGKGAGYTKEEARDNAWKDLKFSKEPKYRERPKDRPISSGGGGGGGGGGTSGSEGFTGCLILIILLIIVCGGIILGLEYLGRKTEDLINRTYPAYETRAEKTLKEKQEWQRWEHFTSNSDQWLEAPESPLSLPGKIIFISSENGNGEIFLADPNSGERPVNLTNHSFGNIVAAAPSLDGKQIAFIADQEGESGIYVMNSDGTEITKIAKTSDGYANTGLIWLPSSGIPIVRKLHPYLYPERILIVRRLHPYSQTIWMVEIIPSQDAFLPMPFIPTLYEYNNEWVEAANKRHTFYSCSSPAVSPDDGKLAYVKDTYYIPLVSAFKIDSQVTVEIGSKLVSKSFGSGTVRLGPQAWSPSGDKLVFHFRHTKDLIGILELRELWLGGHSLSQIHWLVITGRNPAWSPDGKWIVFDNEGTIYAVEVASGNVRKITGPRFLGKSGENPLWVR